MSNNSDAREKVCNIIYAFIEKLYMHRVNRERDLQFAMALLCKAKGHCNVLTRVEEELSVYGIKAEEIDNIVSEIRSVCEDKIDEILPACADIIMGKYTNGPWGEYLQPRELTELIHSLMREKECKVVYNPFAGLASYAIADFIEIYYGQDISFSTSNIAKMRLELNNIDYSHYENSNSISEWNDHGADCIVSTPPFGLRLNPDNVDSEGSITCEEFLFRKFLSRKSKYAFFVVARSICNNSNRYIFEARKEISDSNFLDMVIDLPSGIFSNTSINTSIIVLSKDRKSDSPITFVDAENLFYKKNRSGKLLDVQSIINAISNGENDNHISVAPDVLKENSYLWNVGLYKAEKNMTVPEGYDLVEFRDITSLLRGIRNFNDSKGRVVMISDLSSDVTNCILNVDNIGISNDLSNTTKIEEPALLISTIRDMKPTLCKASPENPLFIHPHIWAFKIEPAWINPQYLCLELSKVYQVMTGASIPRVSREQLSKTKLPFPSKGLSSSYKEQGQLYDEFVQATKLAKAKELGLQEVIDKMKAEYINVIRTRKHDMRPYVRELDSAEELMRFYLSKKDEMADFSQKMNIVLDQFHVALSNLSDLIDIFSEEDKFGKPEPFNIDKYFFDMEINNEESISGYSLEYYCDDNALHDCGMPVHKSFRNVVLLEDWDSYKDEFLKADDIIPLMVDIASIDFERMVQNIINNAKEHGFTDPKRNDYIIIVDVTVIPEKNMFQIDFSNNGNPLPNGLDKQRYGMLGEKAGITGGTGRGGYVVKSIVEHYGGDFDVFMEGENTVIRITLPISK